MLLGFNQEKETFTGLYASYVRLISAEIINPSAVEDKTLNTITNSLWNRTARAGFGRISYDFKERYLFTLNARYDGSSKFPKEDRFQFFPTFSLGWKISEENFMRSTRSVLDNLMLRGSWGRLGSQPSSHYPYQSVLTTGNAGYLINGSFPGAMFAPGLVSPTLKWPETTTINVGVDWTLLHNRLTGSVDVYRKKVDKILTDGTVKYPGVLGASAPLQNSGEIKGKGWELAGCSDDDDDLVVNISLIKDQVANEENYKVINLKDNATLQLEVHIMPVTARNKEVTFSAGSNSVVTVSETGLVTPVAIGRDTITITAKDGSGAFVKYPINVITHIVKASSITLTASALNVQIEIGSTYDLSDKYKVNPDDATEKGVTFSSSDESIVTVDETGLVTAIQQGTAVITIKAIDGSNQQVKSEFTVVDRLVGPVDYDRRDWGITVSHPLPPEGGNNRGECILDGDDATFLSMIKPGHEMDGISVDPAEDVYFIIDMKEEQEVDYFRYVHRNSNIDLRFLALSVYGSSDGTNFTVVQENVDIPNAETGAFIDPGNVIIPKSKYRYYKFSFTKWLDGVAPGQLREFYLGYIIE